MKRIVMLLIFATLAGLTLNCSLPAVPENSFRIRTRGRFHLFGIPLPFSVPNPNIAINLKMAAPTNPPGSTGSVTEFLPGGAFTTTNSRGYFDAVNAVVPAPYNLKIAPGQSMCSAPTSSVFPFYANNGGTYNVQCRFNIQINFLIEPGYIDLSTPGSSGNTLNGADTKSIGQKAVFRNAQNLRIRYYRHESGEDYVLDGEKLPISVSPDGSEMVIPIPDYFANHGLQFYRIVIFEDGATDTYLGHGEVSVDYPPAPTPSPTLCPVDMICECPPGACV